MIRKLTLAFLLFFGLQSIAHAQVRDSITISIPPYTDTTCIGSQLVFSSQITSDTFTGLNYRWYANGVFTGITLDTFTTTALNDGDSVYCWLYFTNSFGIADSSRSNAITIYRAATVPARVIISLIEGNNPDCAGHPVKFSAYPVNGGTTPTYQWYIDGVEVLGADSSTFRRIFNDGDSITCRMVSNSTCAPVDTVYSDIIPITHIRLTQTISIGATRTSLCQGFSDTLVATALDYGTDAIPTYQWFRDSVAIPGAINATYITDSLRDGDSVYCVISTADTCVLNPIQASNTLVFSVFHVFGTYAYTELIMGSNPGCADSMVTFRAVFDTFGTAPNLAWYVNNTLVLSGTSIYPALDTLRTLDSVSFVVYATDGGCYTQDTIRVPATVMIRNPIPLTPVVSLVGTSLIGNLTGSNYVWYRNTVNAYAGASPVPGATGDTYHPGEPGYYYCYRDSVDCFSGVSNIIYISLLDVNDVHAYTAKIFPNPTTGMLNINMGSNSNNFSIAVVNALGQTVLNKEVKNNNEQSIDISSLPSGVYQLILTDEKGYKQAHQIMLNN